MPKFLRARPPLDDSEAGKIRRLSGARHAPADWSERARIVALSWDSLAVPAIAAKAGCHENTVRRCWTPSARRPGRRHPARYGGSRRPRRCAGGAPAAGRPAQIRSLPRKDPRMAWTAAAVPERGAGRPSATGQASAAECEGRRSGTAGEVADGQQPSTTTPSRSVTVMRRLIRLWEYRHLRAVAGARTRRALI